MGAPVSPRSFDQLMAGLDLIRQSPEDDGVVELIVRRPARGARDVLDEAEVTTADGLVGDRWSASVEPAAAGAARETGNQITLANSRVMALLAGERTEWPPAGDQIYLDLDLSTANLPAGTLLTMGSAVIEVTDLPHTGCGAFAARFGRDAARFVNSPIGRELNLRGINARVFQTGVVRTGDVASKLAGD